MCDFPRGVCACVGENCPAYTQLDLTPEQRKRAEACVLVKGGGCFCDGLVDLGLLTEKEKERLVELYRLGKLPSRSKKRVASASRAQQLASTALAEFVLTTNAFIEEN